MSYTKSGQGQAATFVTQPEAVPVPWGLAALGVLPVVIFQSVSLMPSTFSVSADAVSIEGRSIRRKDIHRAIIRNHVLSGGQLADISCRVDMEAGGVPHTLAGGLNESTAFAILTDVCSILGLQHA